MQIFKVIYVLKPRQSINYYIHFFNNYIIYGIFKFISHTHTHKIQLHNRLFNF